MKIIDNFLSEREFINIKEHITSMYFPWNYTSFVNDNDDPNDMVSTRYFEHNFYNGVKSQYFHLIRPFLNKLYVDELYRVKANLFPSTESVKDHAFHCDTPFIPHRGAILYLNTCDGYTLFPDGTKVESIENRCLLFDPTKPHASSTCSNAKARFNINVNYTTTYAESDILED